MGTSNVYYSDVLTLTNTGPTGLAVFSGHVWPSADLAYDLGSTGSRWQSLYVGTGTIYIGDAQIGASGTTLEINGGINFNNGSGGTGTLGTNDSCCIYSNNPIVAPQIYVDPQEYTTNISGGWHIGPTGTRGTDNYQLLVSNVNSSGALASPYYSLTPAYGMFASDISQSLAGASTPTAITLNRTDIANGVEIVDGSGIRVLRSGVYKFGISPQFLHKVNDIANVIIWPKINDVDISGAGSYTSISKNQETLIYVSFILSLTGQDVIKFMFRSSDASVRIAAVPSLAGQYPSCPSVIFDVHQIA